jgi:hypothetical protein
MIADCTMLFLIDDARTMAPHTNCRQVAGCFSQMERKSESDDLSSSSEIEERLDINGAYWQ